MNSEVQDILTSGVTLTDAALERLLPSATTEPHSIHRAMRHSTFAGGKRLRPILCMEAARMVAGAGVPSGRSLAAGVAGAGQIPAGAADLGAAIEMAHTYSLIHDDLPALDNDDLRRGQPTCHVAFGEAIAILAGDALQNLAFQVISNLPAPPATVVAILHDFALAIGTGVGDRYPAGTGAPHLASEMWVRTSDLPPGMIGGQVVDIESEGHAPTPELVERIHRAKTGALITTSIVCGGLLGLAPKSGAPGLDSETWVSTNLDLHHTDILARLRTFGESAGLAFQIVDDILDMTQTSAELGKTAGKDTAAIKATWPAVYGIERSRKDAAQLIADAFAALAPFGPAATPLKSLAQYLVDRTH
jgi:geranylgeranyl diphosphate synthase type II